MALRVGAQSENDLPRLGLAHAPDQVADPEVVREGTDVTVVTCGALVKRSMDAAKIASDQHGIEAEVIDLRTVQPLDIDTIVTSARKTNRIVVVHEAVRFGGLGAEIAAQIQEHAFDHLDAPVARVGAPFSPIPFSPALETAYVPNADRIAAEIRTTLHRPVPGVTV